MTPEEIRQKRLKAADDVWYISRVLVGLMIHVFMIFCAFAFAEQAVEVMRLIPDHHDVVSQIPERLTDVLVAVPAFTAGMAGAHWVKGLYVRFFLPEAMDDITKKILEKQ